MERSNGTLETTIDFNGDVIEIWRAGKNDYWANFLSQDCSVRGTLIEVMDEITEAYGTEALDPQYAD